MGMKVLVLGSRGMFGHVLVLYLQSIGHDVVAIDRSLFSVTKDSDVSADVKVLVEKHSPDSVVNCIGMLRTSSSEDPQMAIRVNSLLPHVLSDVCSKNNVSFIHISTDCWKDLDVYGRSKRAGEVFYSHNLTIRTSIIGPEIKKEGSGLFHWFFSQEGDVNGYTEHIWDGVTTLELARKVEKELSDSTSRGLIDFRTQGTISKYDLLKMIGTVFLRNNVVHPEKTNLVDKSSQLDSQKLVKSYETQLRELKEWIELHRELYEEYKK